ncbi:MAG: LPS export ABC transporter permease LptF [Herminiimonas sp.]|nr:LPS export ABC transporter permease LptF [Herminiimonas sp.]
MIFQRALRRELRSTAGAVFTTLFTITITIMLIRILGQAAGGKVASQDVIALIGFAALTVLPVLLINTGFIAVLLVVTRSYQDSEMVVWFTAGLSLSRWIKPVLTFGAPIVLMTALLSFVVTPWAHQQSAEFRERFEKRGDIAKVSPGKFQESSSADRVFFVEGVNGDGGRVRNIFVNSVANGRPSIVVANEGRMEFNAAGDKFLVLSKGRRYDGVPNQSDFQIMEFERYGVLVGRQAQAAISEKSARTLPLAQLIAAPTGANLGELLWRIALPLMSLLLLLVAIPLGFVNPRGGRSSNVLIALLLYVVYSNMISVFQAGVVQGRMSLPLAWWPMHLTVLTTIAALFLWRLNTNSARHPLALWSSVRRLLSGRTAAQ